VAASYARESGASVAWLGLHAGDRDARFFFGRLAGALTAAFGDEGDDLLPSLRRGLHEGADAPGLARLLVADLARAPAGFILVLDDYHTIRDANDIHEAVDILVRGLPEAGQTVITAREPPPLSIRGLVVHDAVFVLGADDLRFAPDETAELRRALGGDASHDVDADGWVAGILLGGAPRQLGATDGNLLDAYVEREVLARLRPSEQRWLETLAVLESITPAAAERLLGPGPWPARLAMLAEACPFLAQAGGHEGSFRLHALVRDALLNRLRRASPRRAHAAWSIARALAEEAFDVASAVRACQELGQVEAAVSLVHRSVDEATRTGRWPASLAALDLLPREVYHAHPRLMLAGAHALVQTGRPEPARELGEAALTHAGRSGNVGMQIAAILELANIARHSGDLNAAEDWLAAAGYLLVNGNLPAQEHRALEGRLLGLRGVCLAIRGQVAPACEDFESAERLLSLNGSSRELAVVQYNLGAFCIRAGDYAAGRSALATGSRHWRAVGDRVMLAMTQLLLGNLHLRLGELEEAGAILASVVEAARAAGALRIEGHALTGLGMWHRANGRLADAATSFDRSLRMAQEVGERELLVRVLRHRAEVGLLQADTQLARDLLARAQAEGQQLGTNVELPAVERALGRLHLVEGASQLALRHFEAALRVARDEWEPDERAVTLYWLGTAHLAVGDAHQAEGALREALTVARDSVGLPILAGPAAEDGRLLRYGQAAGVHPSALGQLDRLAATRRPWTGLSGPTLEVVSRQELPRLEVRLFGALAVCRDGQVVQELATRDRARELFALLLLHPDGLPAREITEQLWPDLAPQRAQHNLRMTAYVLRGFLGGKAAVQHARLAYRVAPRLEVWTDTHAFDAALLRSRQTTGAAAQAALEEALGLYRGPLLADSGWEWVAPARAIYQARATAAALRLAGLLAGVDGRRSDALAEWALAVDPLSEPAYEQLLRNAQARRDLPAEREITRRYQEMAARNGLRPNPLLVRAI
jgi:ATP/maltotriose-dependent transcriptional regulator MalT/DNA-binding SARP family transcriptional activator